MIRAGEAEALKPMMGTWHSLIRISRPDPVQVVAEWVVNADSPWFSGHFPGNPILPGIAQLGMVLDAIQEFGHRECRVSEIKKVRFKQMIRPNDAITIMATCRGQSPTSYSFRVMVKGQVACTGLLIAEESSVLFRGAGSWQDHTTNGGKE
ncbi:MAG: 3-hydroxyacyl-[acyl-carrier-protein] dehydratase [Thermodesulfobacteriota bacterium]|nr:3-hydroxyacyl-[acyl-carrier-protein] dehydratase [Thermodesulfobacteriota bacterium]